MMSRFATKIATIVALLMVSLPIARAQEVKLVIGKKDCRWLSAHVPADDVRYQPGVDVRGRKVAPADLSSSRRIKLQDQILLSLDIPLGEFLGAAAGRLASADVNAGQVSIDTATGEVSYNGQAISDDGQRGLAAACREMAKRGR